MVQLPEPDCKQLSRAVLQLAKDMQQAKEFDISIDDLYRNHKYVLTLAIYVARFCIQCLMTNPNFICPVSQEPCESYHMCAAQKEIQDEGGAHPESHVGILHAALPTQVVDAMISSYCAIERINALGELSEDGSVGDAVRELAVASADAIFMARAMTQNH